MEYRRGDHVVWRGDDYTVKEPATGRDGDYAVIEDDAGFQTIVLKEQLARLPEGEARAQDGNR